MLTKEKDEIDRKYREVAPSYDRETNLSYLFAFRGWKYRKVAIAALALKPGDCVVEIGCGTGLNFGLILDLIGPTGKIVGVDLNREMLNQAEKRVAREGWRNVELQHKDAAEFVYPEKVNGILSTFALTLVPEYDEVIRKGADALVADGRWVVADFRMPQGWSAKLTPLLLKYFARYAVSTDLADRHPWESLQKYMEVVAPMRHFYLGYIYVIGAKPRSR